MRGTVLFVILVAIFAATLASSYYAWERTNGPAAKKQVKQTGMVYALMAFFALVFYGISANLPDTHPELTGPMLTFDFVVGSFCYAVYNMGWFKRKRAEA